MTRGVGGVAGDAPFLAFQRRVLHRRAGDHRPHVFVASHAGLIDGLLQQMRLVGRVRIVASATLQDGLVNDVR
jgi:hypothetical protein